MSTVELRKKLIEKIKKSENGELLEEAYRLLELGTEDLEIYKLTEEQRTLFLKDVYKSRTGSL